MSLPRHVGSVVISLSMLAACGAGSAVPAGGSTPGDSSPGAGTAAAAAPPGAAATPLPGPALAAQPRYRVTVLATDDPTRFPGAAANPQLVNGWGLDATPTSFWWVADNGSGSASLLDATGTPNPALPFVTVTGAGGAPGTPTGVVAYTGTAFQVTGPTGPVPARFLFAAEDGTISGWAPGSEATTVVVDHSVQGEVFKGLAHAATASGDRLYATDFHDGRVEVFDGSFAPVATEGSFTDPDLPAGFAPFGIRVVEGAVLVTFAKQDAAAHDDGKGRGLGVVSAFDTDGRFLRRIAGGGKLDAPWGLALAPADFGAHSGKLLVGNFGDGHVVAYRVAFPIVADEGSRGPVEEGQYLVADRGGRVTIDGLWGIAFGNGGRAGPTNALFFAAGPVDESHGAFGRIDVVTTPAGSTGR
jgi:uncharacterized protein (TIGR03118 family)